MAHLIEAREHGAQPGVAALRVPDDQESVRAALASSNRASRRRRAATRQPVGRGMVGISTDHFFTPSLICTIPITTKYCSRMPRTIRSRPRVQRRAAEERRA